MKRTPTDDPQTAMRSVANLSTRRVAGDVARAVCWALDSSGHDAPHARMAAGLGELQHARHVTLGAASALWRHASAVFGSGSLGVAVAEQSTRREPSLVAYLIASAASLTNGVELAARFASLSEDLLTCSLTRTDATLTLTWGGSARLYLPAVAEFAAARLVAELRAAATCSIRPRTLTFTHAASRSKGSLTRWFGVAPRFGAAELSLSFDRTALQPAPRAPDPVLHAHLVRLAERELEDAGRRRTVAERVRELIAEEWRQGSAPLPGRDTIARRLHVTPRTLARWLQVDGRTYSDVVDEVRLLTATRELEAGALSLAALAQQLGFEDQSAFTRAFRRWTGTSPGAYRKGSHAAPGSR